MRYDSYCILLHLDLPKVGQCIKIKSFRWQQSESCQNVNMKNAYLYCHPVASVIYIEANFPAGNTRILRVPTNQIEEAGTDIQLDGNNLSICMETLGKYIDSNKIQPVPVHQQYSVKRKR